MIPVKTQDEIAQMRAACKIAANVLHRICKLVQPGISTYELDQAGKSYFEEYGAESACFGYQIGSLTYPAYTCLSVNDEIVHGIGNLRTVLREGDIITVDVCALYNGFIGDNARTVGVGEISEEKTFLLTSTSAALEKAIEAARSGNRVGDISASVEGYILPRKLGIVRDFVGHGVGRTMHEPPQIPNFGPRKRGERLRPGMTLAIEPMITFGSHRVKMDADGWTARTADGSPSAHFEHTVLITGGDPEILTNPDNNI